LLSRTVIVPRVITSEKRKHLWIFVY